MATYTYETGTTNDALILEEIHAVATSQGVTIAGLYLLPMGGARYIHFAGHEPIAEEMHQAGRRVQIEFAADLKPEQEAAIAAVISGHNPAGKTKAEQQQEDMIGYLLNIPADQIADGTALKRLAAWLAKGQ